MNHVKVEHAPNLKVKKFHKMLSMKKKMRVKDPVELNLINKFKKQ